MVGTGVAHASPWIRAIRDGDADLERAETCASRFVFLEKVFEFLVDGDGRSPACRGFGSALNVSGVETSSGEETGHPAHVTVAVAADAVREAFQHGSLVLEGSEAGENLGIDELPVTTRPELVG